MPAKKKRSKAATEREARRAAQTEESTVDADGAADADAAEPTLRRIDDVITTKRNFDVAGFGVVRGITTHLMGALIGKSVSINNSAWPGYSGGDSDCVIDALVPAPVPGPVPAPVPVTGTGTGDRWCGGTSRCGHIVDTVSPPVVLYCCVCVSPHRGKLIKCLTRDIYLIRHNHIIGNGWS